MAHSRSARFARDDKKERVVERRGPEPGVSAVVGAGATSISSPSCEKSKKVTTPRDDKKERVVARKGQLLDRGIFQNQFAQA
jgi:hypothetical protein